METTEYDVKSLTIGDNDISSIGDGTATGAITELNKNTVAHQTTVTCNNNLKFSTTATIQFARVGNLVTLRLVATSASPTSTGWITIASVPEGYRPIFNISLAMQLIANSKIVQGQISNNNVQVYVSSAGTEYCGFTASYVTTDSMPSQ